MMILVKLTIQTPPCDRLMTATGDGNSRRTSGALVSVGHWWPYHGRNSCIIKGEPYHSMQGPKFEIARYSPSREKRWSSFWRNQVRGGWYSVIYTCKCRIDALNVGVSSWEYQCASRVSKYECVIAITVSLVLAGTHIWTALRRGRGRCDVAENCQTLSSKLRKQ